MIKATDLELLLSEAIRNIKRKVTIEYSADSNLGKELEEVYLDGGLN